MVKRQQLSVLDMALAEDLAMLHDVVSIERRTAIKRDTLIPKYAEHVEQLKANNSQHKLIGYYLVWLFDAGLIEEGIELAHWCIENHQPLPERFRAKVPYFVASQVIDWAEAQHNAERDVEPYLSDVLTSIENVAEWEIPDAMKARYYRMRGLRAEAHGHMELAEHELARSLALGGKVKTALDAVRKRLERQQVEEAVVHQHGTSAGAIPNA